jgi:hypothetical protein
LASLPFISRISASWLAMMRRQRSATPGSRIAASLVEAHQDIARPIDHRIHQHVHGDEGQPDHQAEAA